MICIVVGSVDLRILACWAGGPGSESLSDDTTDKRNVVQDSLEDEDDDKESKHLYVVKI